MASKSKAVVVIHEWNGADLRDSAADQRISDLIGELEGKVTAIDQVTVLRKMISGATLRMEVETRDLAGLVRNGEEIEGITVVDEPLIPVDSMAFKAMDDAEIQRQLAEHQARLDVLKTVAKSKGIEVKEGKSERSPREQLDMHLDKLGYAVGTRRHAENRVEASELGATKVLEGLKWDAGMTATEVAQQLVDGYRRAHKHHSFPSRSLSGKAAEPSDVVVLAEILQLVKEHGDAHDDRIWKLVEGAELDPKPRA